MRAGVVDGGSPEQSPVAPARPGAARRACLTAALGVAMAAACGAPASSPDARAVDAGADTGAGDGGGARALVVREELAAAAPERAARRTPLLVFAHLTDLHVIDEESPARVEFLDRYGGPFTGAYRPNEGLTPHVLATMVRAVAGARGPLTGRPPALVMTTGDNSDNTQRNETRWIIDILDGGTVNPDSGDLATCGGHHAPGRYHGVRGGGEYYDPDGMGGEDGPGYSDDPARNQADVGRGNALRDFPGLLEDQNAPFTSSGLGLPWYAVFGNHDGLMQGNAPRNPAFAAVATGCAKVLRPRPDLDGHVLAALGKPASSPEVAAAYRAAFDQLVRAARDPGHLPTVDTVVPADPERVPLTKKGWIAEHFVTRGAPVGHGFGEANLASGQGNYVVLPTPGITFLVLDTVAENGGDGGNVDDAQFRWAHQELLAAEARGDVVLAFGHHTLRTMDQPPVSPFAPGDQGGDPSPLVHLGLGPDGEAPCHTTDAAAEPTPDETVRCLFLRHPGLVAYVAGHEHQNVVLPRADGERGFWEVATASHVDWPQQGRLLELFDNGDGTLSIVGTLVEHAAPVRPEDASGVERLAAISREVSLHDPHAKNGLDGSPDAAGGPGDRDVELLVRRPR